MKNLFRPLFLLAAAACALLHPHPAAAQLPGEFYTIPILPGQNLIANQLDTGDNTLNQVLPVVPPGSQCMKWDEASGSFSTDIYIDPLVGWRDSTGLPSSTVLGPREAAFLFNPGPLYDLTISGSPRTNSPPPPLARGVLHYLSAPTKAIATMGDFRYRGTNFPTDPTDDCSIFLRWNPASQTWLTNMFTACHWSLGEPTAAIGEGVAIWLPTNPPPPTVVCPPDLAYPTCDPAGVTAHYEATLGTNRWISCFPPSGTLFAAGVHTVVCTGTNDCGEVLADSFQITVRPMPVPLPPWWTWTCGSPVLAGGLAHYPLDGTTITLAPVQDLADFTFTIRNGKASPILAKRAQMTFTPPVPGGTATVEVAMGPVEKFAFTTVLDMAAPVGTTMEIIDPSDPGGVPVLTIARACCGGGWDLKKCKGGISDSVGFRTTAVNDDSDLLGSFGQSLNESNTNSPLELIPEAGVTQFPITLTFDRTDGTITCAFPGSVAARAGGPRRKGWDGTIKGRPPGTTEKKVWDGLIHQRPEGGSMVIFTPFAAHATTGEVIRVKSGFGIIVVGGADPENINIQGFVFNARRKWSDGHVTLMKAYDDGTAERGMAFTPLVPGGGVEVDLGYTASFDFRLTHFENGDLPAGEYLLTRTIGPIALTNRPGIPKPYLDAMLFKAGGGGGGGAGGVECSADFNGIGSPTVQIQILRMGIPVATRNGVTATLDIPLFTMPDWPARLGKLGGALPCRRGKPPILGLFTLPGGGGLPPEVVEGDEFRVLAELSPDSPHPDYYGGFEFSASAGAAWGVHHLATVSALTPGTAAISPGAGGTSITVTGGTEGFRYLGAEEVTGPFFDLGDAAFTVSTTNKPVFHPVPRESPSRIYRLRESPTRRSTGKTTVQ